MNVHAEDFAAEILSELRYPPEGFVQSALEAFGEEQSKSWAGSVGEEDTSATFRVWVEELDGAVGAIQEWKAALIARLEEERP